MKKILLAAFVLLGFFFACNNDGCPPAATWPAGDTCSVCNLCADPSKKDSLCNVVPHDVAFRVNSGYVTHLDSLIQPRFDFFSWQSFVALNWAADANGNPSGAFNTNPNAPRVWETFVDPDTVFVTPHPHLEAMNSARLEAKRKGLKFFRYASKFADTVRFNNSFLESDDNALIDRNLNFVLFEEKINPVEYNYIMRGSLNTWEGQLAYTAQNRNAIQLPAGFYAKQNPYANDSTVGSIEIKASWRILLPEKGDDTSRYYHRQALVFIPGTNTVTGQNLQFTATVGLVGLHIIHKTSAFQLMVWTSFEHVDNIPENLEEAAAANPFNPNARRYSFYDPRCVTCPPNVPPGVSGHDDTLKWAMQMPYAEQYANLVVGDPPQRQKFGTQVVRMVPIYYKTQQINRYWQSKVKGSVWENYKLVGSQWGLRETNVPFAVINAPHLLANSTMETFIQKDASCISCHNFATMADTAIPTDMSFLFRHAKKPK